MWFKLKGTLCEMYFSDVLCNIKCTITCTKRCSIEWTLCIRKIRVILPLRWVIFNISFLPGWLPALIWVPTVGPTEFCLPQCFFQLGLYVVSWGGDLWCRFWASVLFSDNLLAFYDLTVWAELRRIFQKHLYIQDPQSFLHMSVMKRGSAALCPMCIQISLGTRTWLWFPPITTTRTTRTTRRRTPTRRGGTISLKFDT